MDRAYANGRVTEWEVTESENFQVFLGTIPADPRIGVLHISIRAKELISDEFSTDLRVSVSAVGPLGSSAVEEIFFDNDPMDSTYFDGLINVDKEGFWDISITIVQGQTTDSVVFRIEVIKTHPLTGAITLAAIIAFLAVLGFSGRKIFIEQKRSKKTKDTI